MSYCKIPFKKVVIAPDGSVFSCCGSWLHKPIGNIFKKKDFKKIWNSKTAQIIRASMINQTYEFCNHEFCPFLLKDKFKPVKKKSSTSNSTINTQKTILNHGPRLMILSYDPTCNLSCKSCRSHIIALSKRKIKFLLKFQANLLKTSLFSSIRELTLTGRGDPFASKVCLTLLQNINEQRFPLLKINLMTNGILFTPKNWEKISSAHYAVNIVKISIDAVSKETYSKVRRGGNFDILLKNLEFISRLKQKKEFKLHSCFLMQKDNYKEMPMFVHLMKKFNFDRVAFLKINNWGIYTEEEFKLVAIHRKGHPEREHFLEVLKSPILKDPIVTIHMSDQNIQGSFTEY